MRRGPSARAAAAFLLAFAAQSATAETADDQGGSLAEAWARINYRVSGASAQAEAFDALDRQVTALAAAHPGRADLLAWRAIVLTSEAGAIGGIAAFRLVSEARTLLLDAARIDEAALDGSIPAYLGLLYGAVPGFPIGFGDEAEARRYFEKALALNQDNLDALFYFADFLADHGEIARARPLIDRGLDLAARADGSIWQSGRLDDLRLLKAKLESRPR